MKRYHALLIYNIIMITALIGPDIGKVSGQALKGTVLNEQDKPVEAVYIINNRTQQHTHTNQLGQFKLSNVQRGDTIHTSHISYHSKKWVVDQLQDSVYITLSSSNIRLNELVISNKLNTVERITDIDIQVSPVRSSQEILRKVPGLFIAQHAGGGKAEQIFLRGFDTDHGTDINLTVNNMPVNMVSHAHGQGYSDLHFIIPETIDKIAFDKGPYYPEKGNFTTAGYVNFETKDKLEQNQLSMQYGMFNTIRTLGMVNLIDDTSGGVRQHAYMAGELYLTDGYFDAPLNLNRLNFTGKYTRSTKSNKLSLTASHFQNRWDASGLIPERGVKNNQVSWFGSIDDNQGGKTSRSNIIINQEQTLDENTMLNSDFYYSHYDFDLFSNFTYYMDDPENGDQIRQRENRNLFGWKSKLKRKWKLNSLQIELNGGMGMRYDQVRNNELSHTKNRDTVLHYMALGDIHEANFFGFTGIRFRFNNWMLNPGIRIDHFNFAYNDKLSAGHQNMSRNKTPLSPKFNIIYNPNPSWQFYSKSGMGFHTNDSRVVTRRPQANTVPKAYGTDLGSIWKPFDKLVINTALWYLLLEQEFVYIGDAGMVEPSGKSRRIGIDVSVRYQLNSWLYLNTDANYAHARMADAPSAENYIPLAPRLSATGGLSLKYPSGLKGSIQYRYLGDRPANEDYSLTAKGYFITDINLSYQWKNYSAGIIAENIFNTKWKEAQFASTSQLQNESRPAEDIHFIAGTPFNISGVLKIHF